LTLEKHNKLMKMMGILSNFFPIIS